MKLNVGIAGFGIVGKRRKKCIDLHNILSVKAVCDKTFKNTGFSDNGIYYFQTYKELLNEDLDVLIVCMTNDIAAEVTMAGLKKGLHVFCEKPPGRNVEDIENVIKLEKYYPNLKLMYGFNHRYHESVKEALKIINSGELGIPINIRGIYGKSKLITFNQTNWRTKREIAGGGVLLDQGIHMVDLMRLLGGEYTEVFSFISNNFWKYDVEDNAYALMRTKSGIIAMLNSSATQWRHRFNLEINLERGSLILGGILTGTKSYGAETLTIVNSDPDKDRGDPKEQTIRYNQDNSWEEEINLFAEFIIKDRLVDQGTSIEALKTMQLIHKIYYADEKWRTKYNIQQPESI